MKTYIITEKDIERLKDALDYNADSWFHPGKVDEWEESLIPQEIIFSLVRRRTLSAS